MVRLLFIGVILYFLFKFLARIFGFYVIRKVQKEYAQQNNTHHRNDQKHKKEGEIEITYSPNDDKKHVKGGDYVDFEEVK